MSNSARLLLVCCLLFPACLLASSVAGRAEDPELEEIVEVALREPLAIEDFLKVIGHTAGLPLYWDPKDREILTTEMVSACNLRSPAQDLFSLVRSVLASYDLVLVPVGPPENRMYRVMGLQAVQSTLLVSLEPAAVELTDENQARYEGMDGLFVTTTVRVEHLEDLDGARSALERLATPGGIGHVEVVPELRAYVLTDFAPAVVAMYRRVRDLDRRAAERSARAAAAPSPRVPVWTHVVRLERIRAPETAEALTALLRPICEDGEAGIEGPVRIVAHRETNALIVTATVRGFEQLKAIIDALDE